MYMYNLWKKAIAENDIKFIVMNSNFKFIY